MHNELATNRPRELTTPDNTTTTQFLVPTEEELEYMRKVSEMVAQSAMWEEFTDVATCMVRAMAGYRVGLDPILSQSLVYVMDFNAREGRIDVKYHYSVVLGQIRKHPEYDYRFLQRDDTGCVLLPLRNGKPFEDADGNPQTVSFTMNDLYRKGWANPRSKKITRPGVWQNDPQSMFIANATNRMARWYFGDLNLMVADGSMEEDLRRDIPDLMRPLFDTAEEMGYSLSETIKLLKEKGVDVTRLNPEEIDEYLEFLEEFDG